MRPYGQAGYKNEKSINIITNLLKHVTLQDFVLDGTIESGTVLL